MPSYVALLRGINVGGKNLIRMPALKACFEAKGFEDVATYIQSGNVLFRAPASPAPELSRRIEKMLAQGVRLRTEAWSCAKPDADARDRRAGAEGVRARARRSTDTTSSS